MASDLLMVDSGALRLANLNHAPGASSGCAANQDSKAKMSGKARSGILPVAIAAI